MDNNQNEVDIKRYELGPGIKAIAMFVMLAMTSGVTWYICKQNTKGDIAESEIEVRKDDNKLADKIDGNLEEGLAIDARVHAERSYNNPCAEITLRELRGDPDPKRVRIPEKYQPRRQAD